MKAYQPVPSQLLRRKQAAQYLGITLKQFIGLQDRIPTGPATTTGQRRYWVKDLDRWRDGATPEPMKQQHQPTQPKTRQRITGPIKLSDCRP